MKKSFYLPFIAALIFPALAQAQIAVAVLPFEGGDEAKAAQQSFSQHITRGGQIAVLADSAMGDILAIHEQAQLRGSALHDISRLKIAEFIITANISGANLTVSAIDVNTGVIVFTKSVQYTASAGDAACRTLASQCRDAIIRGISGADREPPDAAKPYLAVLGSLVASLASGDEASFPYVAVYNSGKYVRPSSDNQKAADKGRQFLKFFRPYFIRSNVTFISIEKKSGYVLIHCVVNKSGSKTKHEVGFVELEDGSIAVLDELHKVIL